MLEWLTRLICENKPAKPTSMPAKPVEFFCGFPDADAGDVSMDVRVVLNLNVRMTI
jgi:hypothetical protein